MLRVLATTLILITGPLGAQSLTERDRWPWSGPESLDWDSELCGLWVTGLDGHATLIDRSGAVQTRIDRTRFSIQTVTATPEGLLLASNSGLAQWVSRDGAALTDPFRIPLPDTEGIVALPDGRFAAVSDDPERLVVMTAVGPIVDFEQSLDPLSLDPPLFEPQGIAYDPTSGTFLIVDDAEATNRLYEVTRDGTILGSVDLSPFGRDPEAVALHAATATLWVGFDQGNSIVTFDYRSATDTPPEPDRCVPSLS